MAQTTILAAGKTAGTSSDVTVAPGDVVKIGLFVTGTDAVPDRLALAVLEDTPGADNVIGQLDAGTPSLVVQGPGTYRVARPAIPSMVNVGVYAESD